MRPLHAIREREPCQRLWIDLDAVARLVRWHVAAVADDHRIKKVLVQVVDIFNHPILHAGRDPQVVEHRKMLHVLA